MHVIRPPVSALSLCSRCVAALWRHRRSWLSSVRSATRRYCYLILIYIATFAILLPSFLVLDQSRWRNSAYSLLTDELNRSSKEDRVQAFNRENDKNVQLAEASLDNFDPMSGTTLNATSLESTIWVSVVITSVARNKGNKFGVYQPKYLTQVVAAYQKLLFHSPSSLSKPLGKRLRFTLVVCNVESNPSDHDEAQRLSKYVRVLDRGREAVSVSDAFEKEKLDYLFCLNSSLSSDAQWVLMTEDDALPRDDIRAVLEHLVLVRLASSAGTVASVKLYHPDRLLGYLRPTPAKMAELLCIGCSLGAITWLVLHRLGCRAATRDAPIVQIALVAYYALLALAAGRANVLELRRASYQLYTLAPAPSCCLPAVLYTRHGAKAVMAHLIAITCKSGYAKDTALDDLGGYSRLRTLTFEPNSYTHIGVYTSLRSSLVDPFYV